MVQLAEPRGELWPTLHSAQAASDVPPMTGLNLPAAAWQRGDSDIRDKAQSRKAVLVTETDVLEAFGRRSRQMPDMLVWPSIHAPVHSRLVWPWEAPNLPAAHGSGSKEPSEHAWPMGQTSHSASEVRLGESENLPAEQGTGRSHLGTACTLLRPTHPDTRPHRTLPGPHCSGAVAPARLAWPKGVGVQSAELVASVRLLYVPAGQLSAEALPMGQKVPGPQAVGSVVAAPHRKPAQMQRKGERHIDSPGV
eukprot:6738716-Prymnesium_polylepis.1